LANQNEDGTPLFFKRDNSAGLPMLSHELGLDRLKRAGAWDNGTINAMVMVSDLIAHLVEQKELTYIEALFLAELSRWTPQQILALQEAARFRLEDGELKLMPIGEAQFSAPIKTFLARPERD
jgi:hypothetical protein